MDNNPNDYNELCEWNDDYYLRKESDLGISNCLWSGVVDQNEDEFRYMFEEQTPIKSYEDSPYSVADSGRSISKQMVEYRESYTQVKRRRMLQFDNVKDLRLSNEPTSLQLMKPKDNEEEMEEVLPEKQKFISGYLEERYVSCNESLDQSSDLWLSTCFNDGMHFNSNDTSISGVVEDQIDIPEYLNVPPETQPDMAQQCIAPPTLKISKGRKSYMKTPTKITSSVVYPFALIKPCGVDGDVTLKEINERICTPPSSKSKLNKDEEASPSYPTSAFSGKPVVVKTKIRTEGGKGSITIMRTKG